MFITFTITGKIVLCANKVNVAITESVFNEKLICTEY